MTDSKPHLIADDYSQFVPFTSRMMAAMRARESQREDRLFDDPFAAVLAGPEAFQKVDQQMTSVDQRYVAARTRFFDDFLVTSKIRQIVLLASGLDARAYRFQWGETAQFFELDLPEVLNYKAALLSDTIAPCQHQPIAADLTQSWREPLLTAGFSPSIPSIWLIEGLLMYLAESHVQHILSTVSSLACTGSQLGLDIINLKAIEYEPYEGYFQFGLDEPEPYLAQYGWQSSVVQPGEEGVNFGRFDKVPSSRDVPDQQRVFWVTAHKN